MGSLEFCLGRGERLGWLGDRHHVAGRHDFGGRERALILLAPGSAGADLGI